MRLAAIVTVYLVGMAWLYLVTPHRACIETTAFPWVKCSGEQSRELTRLLGGNVGR